ncbi:DUF2235 domain-containing protein [Paracoccus aurantiacus]|uniref:DUF2235 domain-containing protein n=1 Tax=Paracoccus aurantiacus TaxID=2599412 RepID=A0A5C6S2D4_9RHOB|nr:DUF2235 domain-containing protein [Paracoccus aurantiacus]TXB68020.1 DUF2235 domain-containing protein [Paracoccus aurantiacus]
MQTENHEAIEQATAAANEAAAEVGSGPVDAVAAGCDLFRFGVFFDGTGNSRDHAGQGDFGAWHTNVDLLERLYLDTGGVPVNGTGSAAGRKIIRLKRYMRGIGVDPDGDTTDNLLDAWPPSFLPGPRGFGHGTGPEGVEMRVTEAIGFVNADIRSAAGDIQPCDIHLDIFGFSRGAAAARHFANSARRGAVSYDSANILTKFLGLFDTVSSLGEGGHTGNFGNVDISTSGNVAERIVHLTAKDEIRKNFPLTLAMTGTRIELVGAHSDLGGGYLPSGDIYRLEIPRETYHGVSDFYRERWIVGSDGNSITREDISSAADLYPRVREIIDTETRHGLQFVSLRVMHREAVAAGVPLETEIGSSIDGLNVRLIDELQEYYTALLDNGYRASPELERRVRSKFGHFSAHNRLHPDIRPHFSSPSGHVSTQWGNVTAQMSHMPEASGRRRVAQM